MTAFDQMMLLNLKKYLLCTLLILKRIKFVRSRKVEMISTFQLNRHFRKVSVKEFLNQKSSFYFLFVFKLLFKFSWSKICGVNFYPSKYFQHIKCGENVE